MEIEWTVKVVYKIAIGKELVAAEKENGFKGGFKMKNVHKRHLNKINK